MYVQPEDAARATIAPRRGLQARFLAWALAHMDQIFFVARNVWPIPKLKGIAAVTRFDDVLEVLSHDQVFVNVYNEKLDVIMGGEPFFLGLTETERYTRDTVNMRMVVRRSDIADLLVPETQAAAAAVVAAAGGRLEIVRGLVQTVTFDVLCRYFGVPSPENGDLADWASTLFEFQFADPANDPVLRARVDDAAPKLRIHIDRVLAERRAAGPTGETIVDRSLRLQAQGLPGFDDVTLRSSLIGFIVGGLPQPPMVVPQALEQLLQRPDALKGAQDAARRDDDAGLAAHVFEAMRFDPLAPALQRRCAEDYKIAAGTLRASKIRAGTLVFAAFRSAMMDGRRVPSPRTFRTDRRPQEYVHFGYGLHTCFGRHINEAILPLMLKPLLCRPNLRRAPGADGQLVKKGPFADRLVVEYDA